MKSNESKSLSFGVGALFPHDSLRVVSYSIRVCLESSSIAIGCQAPLSSMNLGINILVHACPFALMRSRWLYDEVPCHDMLGLVFIPLVDRPRPTLTGRLRQMI